MHAQPIAWTLLLAMGWCPAWAQAHEKPIEVCPSGCNYASIQFAINHASAGDTIWIQAGIYRESNIKVQQPMHIIGKDYPTIDANFEHGGFTILSDSVTLEGLRIRNTSQSFVEDHAGIKVIESKYVFIKNNKIERTYFGIYFQKSTHSGAENNHIEGNATSEAYSGNAIHLWNCDHMRIIGNRAISHRDGIYFEFVNHSLIAKNHVENNLRYGLHFMFSNHDQYLENTFIHNKSGVAVMFSRSIIMKRNHFERNWGDASYGLLLKEIYDGALSGNQFSNNTIAIYAEGTTRMRIDSNQFLHNGWAMKMLGSSIDNQIMDNTFIGNNFDVATNTAKSSNIYARNYWSHYRGYDLNRDGWGDVPYPPVSLFSHVIERVPESIMLLRSFFIDLLSIAQKVIPQLSEGMPLDRKPRMKPMVYDTD